MWFWQKKYYFDFHHFYFSTKFTSFTTFIMSWLREFFFFIFLLLSLRHSQKQIIIIWLLLPWPRVKKFFFHLVTTFSHGHRKRILIFIAPLLWLRYDHEKKCSFFYFTCTFTMEMSSYMILHLPTTLIRHYPSKNFPNDILPGKNMCNLKNFLSQEFQWSLTWFTSRFYTC